MSTTGVPEGWKQVTIESLCEFSNGHGFRPPDWSDHGYPIIRIQNLNGSTDFNYFAGEPDKDWLVEPGTILFAWAGTRGVSFGPTIWNGPLGVLNQHIFRVQPKETVVADWLFLALEFATWEIERRAHGFKSTLVHVRRSDITNQVVLLPPTDEQQKIVLILSNWDKAIDKTEHLISALQKRKKGLMQLLLTAKVRFPEFTMTWAESELGNILDERIERGFEDLPLLSVTENGITYRDELDRRDNSSEDKSKYLRICPGDIGYNTMRMWQGRSALSKYEGIVSPAYTVLVPKETIYAMYISYLFKYQPIIHIFSRYSQGLVSDTWSLKYPVLAKIHVKIPEHEEQKRIADVLELCDKEITKAQAYYEKLQEQKKGLIQKLLTGQIRVKI